MSTKVHRTHPSLIQSGLLNSDPAVKQILLTMNEKQHFIIEDLDDHHLVIQANDEYRVRKELEAEVLVLYGITCKELMLNYICIGNSSRKIHTA